MTQFLTMFQREWQMLRRQWFDYLQVALFFIMFLSLFPLAISPEKAMLHKIAPGVVWLAALLASLSALQQLFLPEYQDGSLEQFALLPAPLPIIVMAKVLAYWLFSTAPLLLLTPLFGIWLHLQSHELLILFLSLLLGTPILHYLGAIISALTLNARGQLLLALLLLPLYIPVLILGVGSVTLAHNGLSAAGMLQLLAALCLFTLSFAPLAIASAVRVSLSD